MGGSPLALAERILLTPTSRIETKMPSASANTAHHLHRLPRSSLHRRSDRLRGLTDRVDRLYWRDQPIATLGDGLNHAWFAGIVLKDPPQFGDAMLQGVVSDKRGRPHYLN